MTGARTKPGAGLAGESLEAHMRATALMHPYLIDMRKAAW